MKFPKKLPIQEAAGIIAGSLAAGFVSKMINDKMPNAPKAVKALIPVGAGILLSANKNVIIKNAGLGMIAKGGADLAAAFIPGIGALDDIFVSEPADQSVLSLPADQSLLSAPEIIEGAEEYVGEEYVSEDYVGEEYVAEEMISEAEMLGINEE